MAEIKRLQREVNKKKRNKWLLQFAAKNKEYITGGKNPIIKKSNHG